MRTEIIGSVGVGKSTLSQAIERHLQQLGTGRKWHFAYDGPEENLPFKLFREHPAEFHVEKNIVFLVNHAALIKSLARPPAERIHCDFSLIGDLAYGDLGDTLYAGTGNTVLEQLYEWITSAIGAPDCLIWLHCGLEHQIGRIRMRARGYETAGLAQDTEQTPYSAAYVAHLNALLERRVLSLAPQTPIIRIDTTRKSAADWPGEWLETIIGSVERAVDEGRSMALHFPPA